MSLKIDKTETYAQIHEVVSEADTISAQIDAMMASQTPPTFVDLLALLIHARSSLKMQSFLVKNLTEENAQIMDEINKAADKLEAHLKKL